MQFDSFSFFGLLVAVIAFLVMAVAYVKGQRESRDKIAELSRRVDMLHQTQTASGLYSPAHRDLCCAVRSIYPQALHGVDYHIGDDGNGPYIREWYYDAPEPGEEELQAAIKRHREEMESNDYRAKRRAAYPSIEDQLDAIHKARLGDTRSLDLIEQQIQRVKEKYPKGKQCAPGCG